jgi:hypothetical protein
LLTGLNTSTAVIGNPVWLGTNGNLIYGLANKPTAPAHLVFIGIVTRVNANNGEIFVRPQNGFELEELHNVSISSRQNGYVLSWNSTTSLYEFVAPQSGPQGPAGVGYDYVFSYTSNTFSNGSKAFDLNKYGAFWPGMRIRIIDGSNFTRYLEGTIEAFYDEGIGVGVTIDSFNGSGSSNNWIFTVSGAKGANGTNGTNGIDGVDGADGAPGKGISSIVRISGNGSAGSTDTYRITYTDATTQTYTVVNGSNGTNGTNGTDGTNGTAATITVGTTTTGAAGTNAIVTNSGTSSAAILNFTIPRGADGSGGGSSESYTLITSTAFTSAPSFTSIPQTYKKIIAVIKFTSMGTFATTLTYNFNSTNTGYSRIIPGSGTSFTTSAGAAAVLNTTVPVAGNSYVVEVENYTSPRAIARSFGDCFTLSAPIAAAVSSMGFAASSSWGSAAGTAYLYGVK